MTAEPHLPRQVRLRVPAGRHNGGQVIAIDQRIAPLIEALWAAGYETTDSCEGGRTPTHLAEVTFADSEQAHRFTVSATGDGPRPPGWHVDAPPAPAAECMVRFPPADITRAITAVIAAGPQHGRAGAT